MTKPSFQSLTGKTFSLQSTITDDGVRLDLKARGFYRPGQCSFFDLRVAHLNARSYGGLSTKTTLERAKQEKKRKYNTRVVDVDNGTFTPLLFSTNGAMGEECAKFHKLLTGKLAEKNQVEYSEVMKWVQTRLSFSILRSTLLTLRGAIFMIFCSYSFLL